MKKTLITAALSLALLAVSSPAAAVAEVTPTPAPATIPVAERQIMHALLAKPVHITIKVGSSKKKRIKTRAATVSDLLISRNITLGATDKVIPALSTKITKKTKVRVLRITQATVTVTEKLVPVQKKKNPKMRRGTTKVLVPGTPGSAQRTYAVTTTNGKVSAKLLLTETILTQPAVRVIEVGTKGKALNLARLKMWNKIARCESGGRWHINTGNGYYGGLQFALGTWRAYGGRDFAKYPHKASKAEQITVANRLYKHRGTRPWGCA